MPANFPSPESGRKTHGPSKPLRSAGGPDGHTRCIDRAIRQGIALPIWESMKLLIAVDSAISTEVLVGAVGVRSWPDGTTAHVLSVVVDAEVPLEMWREFGYGKDAVRREMERKGEQITGLAVERLKEVGIPAAVVVTRGDPRHLIPFFARKWFSDLIFVRAHVRKDFEHWMLGSVARAVVTTAPCTVQIVRNQTKDRAHTLDGVRRCYSQLTVRRFRCRRPKHSPDDLGPKGASSGL